MKLNLYCFSLSSMLTVFPDSADAQTYSNKGMAQRVESGGLRNTPTGECIIKPLFMKSERQSGSRKTPSYQAGEITVSFLRVVGL